MKAFFYARVFFRSDILGRKIGHAVSNRGKRSDYQIIQLYRSGVTGGDADAKSVNTSLNHYISD